jgi:hypothetical protein
MKAPWTPGEKVDFLVLNHFGQPYLAIRFVKDQSDLIVIRQVTGFTDGVATLGHSHQYYFRCELNSRDLVSHFERVITAPAIHKFVPSSDTPKEDDDVFFNEARETQKHDEAEDGVGQPATAPESKPKAREKPKPESGVLPR